MYVYDTYMRGNEWRDEWIDETGPYRPEQEISTRARRRVLSFTYFLGNDQNNTESSFSLRNVRALFITERPPSKPESFVAQYSSTRRVDRPRVRILSYGKRNITRLHRKNWKTVCSRENRAKADTGKEK